MVTALVGAEASSLRGCLISLVENARAVLLAYLIGVGVLVLELAFPPSVAGALSCDCLWDGLVVVLGVVVVSLFTTYGMWSYLQSTLSHLPLLT